MFGVKLSISFYFIALLMLLLIIDRRGVFLMSLLAVFLHELAHLSAMLFLRIDCISLQMVLGAVKIKCNDIIDVRKKAFIALFGPFANFLLAFFLLSEKNMISLFGASNFVLGIFNFLPISGLDGGDILEFALMKCKYKRTIYFAFSLIFIVLIFRIGVEVFLRYGGNPSLLIVGVYLIILNLSKI